MLNSNEITRRSDTQSTTSNHKFIAFSDAQSTTSNHKFIAFSDAQSTTPDDKFIAFPTETAARVKFAMASASKFLAKQGKPPTQKNPVIIEGRDTEQLRFLWTALMIIGEKSSAMKFGSKEIKVKSSLFNPNTEKGYFATFGNASLYETTFKQHVIPTMCEVSNDAALYEDIPGSGSIEEQIEQKKQKFVQENQLKKQREQDEIDKKNALKRQQELEQQKAKQLAQEKQREEQIRQLQEKEKIKESNTLLFKACYDPEIRFDEIKKILQDGANINYQDPYSGYTPLMIALNHQNDRLAEYLLFQGADPLLTAKNGDRAIHLSACNTKAREIIDRAEGNQYYGEVKERYIKQINEKDIRKSLLPGCSPTELNIAFHREISSITPQARKIKNFINNGANINYQDNEGYTALMLAIDHQNDRIAEYLLNQGADPLIQNKYHEIASDLVSRNSPLFVILKNYELFYASLNGHLSTVKTLLKNGADINFEGPNGYTPLLIAVEQGALEIVAHLLSQGADLTVTLKDGNGVFELVTDKAIFKLLNNANAINSDEQAVYQDTPTDSGKNMLNFFTNAGSQ